MPGVKGAKYCWKGSISITLLVTPKSSNVESWVSLSCVMSIRVVHLQPKRKPPRAAKAVFLEKEKKVCVWACNDDKVIRNGEKRKNVAKSGNKVGYLHVNDGTCFRFYVRVTRPLFDSDDWSHLLFDGYSDNVEKKTFTPDCPLYIFMGIFGFSIAPSVNDLARNNHKLCCIAGWNDAVVVDTHIVILPWWACVFSSHKPRVHMSASTLGLFDLFWFCFSPFVDSQRNQENITICCL